MKRSFTTLLAIALLLTIAAPSAAASRAASPRQPAGQSTQAMQALIARVEKDTQTIRGLRAKHAVPVSLLAPAAFKSLVERDFDRDTSATDIRDADQPLVLLGLLPRSADLRAILRTSQGDNVAAFYDPKVKRFYVPLQKGGLSLNDQVTISHEYTHALQDQTFDLNKVRPDTSHATIHNSDRDLAETALIEGDATVEMLLFAQTTFTQQQYLRFQQESQQAAAGSTDNTPRYLLDQLIFPYDQGSIFEMKLLRSTAFGPDFSAVNAAFRHAPVSTREILHPEVYQANPTAPVPDLAPPAPALPAGWSRVDSDVVGEYELQDMLAQRLDSGLSAQAADGWRADRYSLFDKGSDFLMAWRLHTDSSASARSLAQALTRYLAARYHTTLSPRNGALTYTQADSALALRLSGSEIYLAVASRGALQPIVNQALASMR